MHQLILVVYVLSPNFSNMKQLVEEKFSYANDLKDIVLTTCNCSLKSMK